MLTNTDEFSEKNKIIIINKNDKILFSRWKFNLAYSTSTYTRLYRRTCFQLIAWLTVDIVCANISFFTNLLSGKIDCSDLLS